MRLAILGAGPAGLSMGRFLRNRTEVEVLIFERDTRVGGKSWTFEHGDITCELGTCYATRMDVHARAWMKEMGTETRPLGSQHFEDMDFFDWAQSVGKTPLTLEVLRYVRTARKLKSAFAARPDDAALRAEMALPIGEWLDRKGFVKMKRLMLRAVTNMGYGPLSETSVLQATRWVDFDLLLSGRLNDLQMPVRGWSALWEHVASDLDVRLGCEVTQVTRSETGVELVAGGERHSFDAVVCAIPLDQFARISEPTEAEQWVNSHVTWRGYCTSLMVVNGWFRNSRAKMFSTGFGFDAPEGPLMSARYDAFEPELGGHIYMLAQLTGAYSRDELAELAYAGVEQNGGTPGRVLVQKVWKYFAQYSADGIRNGIVSRLKAMQGEQSTWYTGATFSFEAVSHITRFNEKLAGQILTAALDRS